MFAGEWFEQDESPDGFRRIIVEKPFGTSLDLPAS